MSATLQFASAATGGAILLDLNTSPWSALQEGTAFPPPPLKRQTTGSLYRDGEEIVAASYANREITLRLLLKVPRATAATANTHIAALNTQLNATRNWLRYRPHASASQVAFRTWRSPDYEPELQEWALGIHIFVIRILADPLATAA